MIHEVNDKCAPIVICKKYNHMHVACHFSLWLRGCDCSPLLTDTTCKSVTHCTDIDKRIDLYASQSKHNRTVQLVQKGKTNRKASREAEPQGSGAERQWLERELEQDRLEKVQLAKLEAPKACVEVTSTCSVTSPRAFPPPAGDVSASPARETV